MKNDPWKTDPQRRLTPEERKMRIEWVKKKRRRRKIFALFVLLFALALISAPIVIFTAFRLKTVNVAVNGKVPYTDAEIVEASGASLGDNVIFFDLDGCAEKIMVKLPYVAKANVTRKLPNAVNISVTAAKERYALYSQSANTYLLLDSELKILAKSDSLPNGVITVIAPSPSTSEPGEKLSFAEENDDTLRVFTEIAQAIETEKLEKINEINITSIADVRATYDSRIMLKLGTASDIAGKLNLAASAIKEEDARNNKQIGTIDLSISKIAYFKPNYFDEKKTADESTADSEADTEPVTDENGEIIEAPDESENPEQGGEDTDEYREYYAEE